MGKSIVVRFDSLQEFYEEALTPVDGHDKSRFKTHLEEDNPKFRGLSLAEIEQSKDKCVKYLDLLTDFDLETNLGSASIERFMSESDGVDMSMERYMDGDPKCLIDIKKSKKAGRKGKYVTLYVNIAENAHINASDMLKRALFSTTLADILENQGFRVQILAVSDTRNSGWDLKTGENLDLVHIEIVLKKFEDPCMPSYILNGLGPWNCRFYEFAWYYGHIKPSWGLGQAVDVDIKGRNDCIVIGTGKCFTEESKKSMIESVSKQFIEDEDEDMYFDKVIGKAGV